jgi:nucleoside 2-deoxyribosyltransferase
VKIYIAAPYPARDAAIKLMERLEVSGHVVTSRWLRERDEMDAAAAQKDLEDVDAADVLLFVHDEGWANKGTGGRHVEFGYALARGKRIVMIGPIANVFHCLDDIVRYEDLATFASAWRLV